MKTCSIAYVLFVSAAIPVLFTASKLLNESLHFGDTGDCIAIIAHGLSIVLFLHLFAKCFGVTTVWRVAIGSVIPILAYTIYFVSIGDQIRGPVVFAVHEMLVFYVIKFVACSALVEYGMQAMEKRIEWLTPRQIGG